MTVELAKPPQMSDYFKVFEAAQRPCDCREGVGETERKAGIQVCRACQARALLNAIGAQAERL